MKKMIQVLLLCLLSSMYLGISVYVTEGVEANNLILPLILEPLTKPGQPQPPESAPDLEPGVQPDQQQPPDGSPLCVRAITDISGSMLNSNAGREVYNAIIKALSESLGPQDQFSLLLFDDQRAFTTVPMRDWGPEVERVLDAVLNLRIKGGDRTFFSPPLEEIAKTVRPEDVLLFISDGLIDTGSRAGDDSERERAIRVADSLKNAGARAVLIPPYARAGEKHYQWLTTTLQAKVITVDQLYRGALASYLASLREAIAARKYRPVLPLPNSGDTPLMTWIGVTVVSCLLMLGLVMLRKLRPPQPVPADGPPHYSLKVSWDSPFEGFKEIPLKEPDTEITIGGDEADTIYSPKLSAGHIKVKAGEDALALTCYGPIRLEDGTAVEPFGAQPAIESFPINQEVPFSAGETVFVVKRIEQSGGNSDGCEPIS